MDYRKFLGKEERLVLPYFGGGRVDAPGRRLRITTKPDGPGWYTFIVKGRSATAEAKADAPPLSDRPIARGHFLNGQLVVDGARLEFLELLPEDEPAKFAPVIARRWHGGELVFDSLDFETGVEDTVRERLAAGESLRDVKAVPATLRAAFGFALTDTVSQTTHIAATWGEARRFVADVAEHGRVAAERGLRALHDERLQTERELAEQDRRRREQQVRAAVQEERERRLEHARAAARDAEQRAQEALEAAGARVTGVRRRAADQLEVTFQFMGERFTVLALAGTLQVLDSGICLGHPPRDDLVTLDSLPSVIREAIEDEKLVRLR